MYPGHPAVGSPKRPVSGGDVAISIVALVATLLFGAGAAVFGLFSLAFLDHCPPETCSAEGAASAVITSVLAAFAVGVVGLVITVVQLVRRKPGWPFAVATLLLCVLAVAAGAVGYSMAVG